MSNIAPPMSTRRKPSFWESQRLAKQRSYEKRAKTKKVKLDDLVVFTQQLAAMLEAGLPILATLDTLKEQTSDPVFQVIIREVRNDVASGSHLSDAVKKYPNAFPNLFTSMVEAGEASGALPSIMQNVASYLESSSRLIKKVKSALAYPIAVISLAIILVNVLLIFVIPVFAEMFESFNAVLPTPTLILIALSDFLGHNIVYIIIFFIVLWQVLKYYFKTKKGRVTKDRLLYHVPIVGQLLRKVAMSRFTRTYSILMRSGVPILRCLEICSAASNNTYIEAVCIEMVKHVNQGGQISEVIERADYFPNMVMHMARAGEKTGNIEGMMVKTSDYFDVEIDKTVSTFTTLLEPALIVFLGVVVGGIVMSMFLPIFQLSSIAGN